MSTELCTVFVWIHWSKRSRSVPRRIHWSRSYLQSFWSFRIESRPWVYCVWINTFIDWWTSSHSLETLIENHHLTLISTTTSKQITKIYAQNKTWSQLHTLVIVSLLGLLGLFKLPPDPLTWTCTEPGGISTAEWRLAALEVLGEGTHSLRSTALCRLAALEEREVCERSEGGIRAGRSAAERERRGGLSGMSAMPQTLPTKTEFCKDETCVSLCIT